MRNREKLYSISLTSTTLVFIYLVSISFTASALQEIQLTQNGSRASTPSIYGDNIVWADHINDSVPRGVDAYGERIIWADSRNGNDDIYTYDFSTSKETQITINASACNPKIHKDRIIWQDYRDEKRHIHLYNISNATEIQTSISPTYGHDIYEDRIVYTDRRNGNSDIFMNNLSTQKEIQITTNKSDQMNPSIYGDRIVWEDYRNGNNRYGDPDRNPDIYMCTLSPNLSTA